MSADPELIEAATPQPYPEAGEVERCETDDIEQFTSMVLRELGDLLKFTELERAAAHNHFVEGGILRNAQAGALTRVLGKMETPILKYIADEESRGVDIDFEKDCIDMRTAYSIDQDILSINEAVESLSLEVPPVTRAEFMHAQLDVLVGALLTIDSSALERLSPPEAELDPELDLPEHEETTAIGGIALVETILAPEPPKDKVARHVSPQKTLGKVQRVLLGPVAIQTIKPVEIMSWEDAAKCRQAEPDTFFPEKGGSTREAKRICGVCAVHSECLEYALANEERFGIWGGKSERERRKLSRLALSN